MDYEAYLHLPHSLYPPYYLDYSNYLYLLRPLLLQYPRPPLLQPPSLLPSDLISVFVLAFYIL